jgi:hypothetical protein
MLYSQADLYEPPENLFLCKMAALIASSLDLLRKISTSSILHNNIKLSTSRSINLLKAHNIVEIRGSWPPSLPPIAA